ncbi:IclR family transcriptional regulator domain-containing protein [Modestobacter versicolor]|uniref:IclR family pca regulon transcriptional regulator n=1 Tax=Modestobacter versicolor TaxID=429133 RepID=A0A839XY58_9ACTN|nr:IclR family transcriptional regulator C-terminal domain-containing protein [Modestobacter versicolor]MBB3675047.1 IclR family pca regulon transcriptional regulator [Modestobacter versicolor]
MTDTEQDESLERGDHYAKTFARGLETIRAFSPEEPELSVSDVARKTGMPRAAARRFLLTLLDLGYVGVTAERRFFLRPAVLELGFTYLSTLTLPQLARPRLVELTAELGETTSLGVRDGDDIVYVAHVPVRRTFSAGITVGTRGPAYLSSHGRVLLGALPPAELEAYLQRVRLERRTTHTVPDREALRQRIEEGRAQGWVAVDEELEDGVTSLAVPVHGPDGDVVASLNLASHSNRESVGARRPQTIAALQRTAAALTRELRLLGGTTDTRNRL